MDAVPAGQPLLPGSAEQPLTEDGRLQVALENPFNSTSMPGANDATIDVVGYFE